MTVGEIHAQAVEIARGLVALDDMGDEDEQRQTLNVHMKAIDEEPLSPRSASGKETRVALVAMQNPKSRIQNHVSALRRS